MPSPLLVNIAKLHFAENYHQMVAYLQDISGGILVTAPGEMICATRNASLHRIYLGGQAGVSRQYGCVSST